MILRTSPLAVVCALLPFVSCSGNTSQFRVTEEVGSAGATIAVTEGPLAGTVLEIPAGALPFTTEVTVDQSSTPVLIGFESVGPGTHFAATATDLEMPAYARLVFDTDLLPTGATTDDVIVIRQTSQGRRVPVEPDAVDLAAGTVDIEVERFAAYWVTVQTIEVDPILATYLPLFDGDVYDFDNGIVLTIESTFDEPNLEGLFISKATFFDGQDDIGLYLRREFTETFLFGEFSLSGELQTVGIPPLLYLPDTAVVGDEFSDRSSATLYQPFGSPIATDVLDVRLQTSILSRGRLDTPLGRFSDVLEIGFELERTNTNGEVVTTSDRLWLARGVGPVKLELSGIGATRSGSLVAGSVGGSPIAAQ